MVYLYFNKVFHKTDYTQQAKHAFSCMHCLPYTVELCVGYFAELQMQADAAYRWKQGGHFVTLKDQSPCRVVSLRGLCHCVGLNGILSYQRSTVVQ